MWFNHFHMTATTRCGYPDRALMGIGDLLLAERGVQRVRQVGGTRDRDDGRDFMLEWVLPPIGITIPGNLARDGFDSLFGSGVETGCDLVPRLVAMLACRYPLRARRRNRASSAGRGVGSSWPQLHAVRLDEKIQPIGIGQSVGLVPGLALVIWM